MFKGTEVIGLAAALTMVVGAASASTLTFYDFTDDGEGSFVELTDGIATITAGAAGILNFDATVTQTANGLGVNGSPDTNPTQIDNFPFSEESITVSFAYEVNLVEFTLGSFGLNEDFDLLIDGSFYGTYGPGESNPFPIGEDLTSFTIVASYGGFFQDGFGNDAFTLQTITTAAVPLPAGGLLLITALGAAAALRRRKAIAA